MDTDCGEGRRGKLNLLAEPAAEPEADPWYSYYGHGFRHYGYGHGYYGYRPYGYYGYGLWGRKKREAEPVAEPAAEPEADPWYSYYGHGLHHYGYGHGYYGYRPYGHYGYGLWGRKKREAEPVAEPAAEPEADPWYSYYGHGLHHYGYGHG